MIRFPKLCTRCGSLEHYAEDCTRIPSLGLSQQERDFEAGMRRDRAAFIIAMTFLIGGLIACGLLMAAP